MIGGELSVAVGGQSVAHMFRRLGKRAFNAELRALAPEAPRAHVWGFTRGGTVAASTNVSPRRQGIAERYWWDMATDAPSPLIDLLIDRVADLAASPCDCLIWDLGQFEADALKGKHGRDADAAREDYRHAMTRILAHVRRRLAPDAPERVPILLMPHAPHPGEGKASGLGVERVRQVQHELIAAIPNCHDAGLVRGMDMKDNLHPSRLGIEHYARSIAATFVRTILPMIDLLIDRVADLAASPCDCLIWDLGQFEADALKGKHGRDADAAREDYRHAMTHILAHVRRRLAPDAPERVPILLMPHAPHPAEGKASGLGVERVRQVQYELIAAIPNCHDAGLVRDMDMKDNLHPSRLGIEHYARSIAATFVRTILPMIDLPAPADGPEPRVRADCAA